MILHSLAWFKNLRRLPPQFWSNLALFMLPAMVQGTARAVCRNEYGDLMLSNKERYQEEAPPCAAPGCAFASVWLCAGQNRSREDVRALFPRAMYYRSRYTALDVAWELGLFEDLVAEVFEKIWV